MSEVVDVKAIKCYNKAFHLGDSVVVTKGSEVHMGSVIEIGSYDFRISSDGQIKHFMAGEVSVHEG